MVSIFSYFMVNWMIGLNCVVGIMRVMVKFNVVKVVMKIVG